MSRYLPDLKFLEKATAKISIERTLINVYVWINYNVTNLIEYW